MNRFLPARPEIHILGRTKIRNPLPLFWTGSGLELRTDSTQLWFELESDYAEREEWIRIEVDGFCLQRMMVPKGRSRICAYRGFPGKTVRTVRLLKEVQPMQEDERKCLLVHSLEGDGSLYKVPEKKYRMEFVGDSLSAGEGLSGARTLVQGGSAVFGLEGHYAVAAADYFKADFRILAESGWGVHCSCHNDYIRTMPGYYEQICGVVRGEHNRELGAFDRNDFAAWQPDIIVVNLGSNDGFAVKEPAWVDPEDGTVHRQLANPYGGLEEQSALRLEASVTAFLKKLRRLNPDAFLLWAYGMCDHSMAPYLERGVQNYREESGDDRAQFLLLPAVVPMWIGSSNHPGIQEHQLAAQVLINKIEEIL